MLDRLIARFPRALPEKKGRIVLTNETTLLFRDTSQSGRSSVRRVCRLTN